MKIIKWLKDNVGIDLQEEGYIFMCYICGTTTAIWTNDFASIWIFIMLLFIRVADRNKEKHKNNNPHSECVK